MTEAERWQRVQALCEQLEGLPAPDREARLYALEADGSLRTETLAMLAALRDEAEFARIAERTPVVTAHPDIIGGVRILARLGSGGSGEVFRGVRVAGGTEQAVAVKRFHAHRATAVDLERFSREQRMLAALTHPDIVRFIDAGLAEDGRPYLVMELAQGDPITVWCDQRQTPLRARLALFVGVCAAVQAAHRHLIVHLDLKPGNILVTSDGRPKLLDFGTAKLAGPDIGLTITEPLTLLYASPERLRGEAVSVACDVYSLGLILYELVSGGWPFRRHDSIISVAERATGASTLTPLARVVTEEAADRRATTLGRLRSALRGDLEAIAAKAIAHEPSARYASVADLAEDVRRYLDGEPVRAIPPGVVYRLGKFVRRRRWETASAALLVVGLSGAAIYSAAQARASRAAADRAEAQNHFLTRIFTLAGTDAASSHQMSVRELLALADARVLPALGSTPAVAADVEVALARGYLSQAAYAEARTLLERGVTHAVAAGDIPRQADARATLAYVAFVQNQTAEAVDQSRSALRLWQTHAAAFSPPQAVSTLQTAASVLSYVNPVDPTYRQYFEACLDAARRAGALVATTDRAQCLRGVATAYVQIESRFDEADGLLREAAALQRADPTSASTLSMTLQLLGLANRSRGRFDEDERAQRESYEILERLQGADSTAALWQRAMWATSLVGAGQAEAGYREAQAVLAAARQRYPARGAPLLWTPISAASTAACYLQRDPACEALVTESIECLGPSPSPTDTRLQGARGLLGLVWARQGRLTEARPLIQGAVNMLEARGRTSPFLPAWRAALAAGAPRP